MKLETVSPEEAVGKILVHNVADAEGHKLLSKGHLVISSDVDKLRAAGKGAVYVARLGPDDVRENEAAGRIARAAVGENATLSAPAAGRVNALAAVRGVMKVNEPALERMNLVDGMTLATVAAHRVVEPRQIVATIKTIGLALPESALAEVEAVAREAGPALWIRALPPARVAVIFSGSVEARRRIEETFAEPIRSRVAELGGEVAGWEYVPEDAEAIADAVTRAQSQGADLIMLAGETSIMDREDVTPRAIEAAGGRIELYGAPVEPGNLLLLAYRGSTPIIGAPGCIKSRDTNVVDLILPRLLAGERVSRAEVIALANGGLLL